MQAAIIEWQATGDAKSGLAWIYNTLFGPCELPDESEKDAQAYFNRKYAPIDENSWSFTSGFGNKVKPSASLAFASKESDMTTITKERLLTIKQWRETYGPDSNIVLPAEEAEELAQIALASLEVDPVAWKVAFTQIDRKYNTFTGMYSDKSEVERWCGCIKHVIFGQI